MKRFGILTLAALLVVACAEKQTRLWIEPPIGYEYTASGNNVTYQVEDVAAGTKSKIEIPLAQNPQNLVVEDRMKVEHTPLQPETPTKADAALKSGKVTRSTTKKTPTTSYLRSLSQVEKLYRDRQYGEALVRLTPILEDYPDQARLYVMQGTLYRKIGEKKLALQAYKQAFALDKSNTDVEGVVEQLEGELGAR